MATASLGRLTLDLVAKISGYTEPLSRAERETKKSTQAISGNFNIVDKAAVSLKGTMADVALAIGGTAASIFSLNKIIEVQRNFDKLNASLITATGSADNAQKVFSVLQDFAQTTPYGLEQSVTAFVKLVNLGLNPSQKALTSYGNTAAAMGKDLDQMIEAVADAATGEFERLKEFGIKASQQNGKVALTFQGTTKVIENSSQAIQDYLLQIGEVNFAGAMENRMKSLDGAFANLEDTLDSVVLKISQSGIGDFIKDSVNNASDSLVVLGENIEHVTDVGLVAGAYFSGKFAAGLILSLKESIAATIAQRDATIIQTQANIQSLGVAALREKQNVALALTELNVAKAEYNSAVTANARAVAIQRVTAAEIAHNITMKQSAATTMAYTTAQNASVGIGRSLLGILGGPVGLGLTLATVAAGFLLVRDNSTQTSDALEDQGLTVDELRVKYEKMTSSQLKLKKFEAIDKIEEETGKINSYKSAIQQVIDQLNSEGDIKQSGALQQYLDNLKAGGDKAKNAFAELEKQGLVSDSNIRMVADLDSKINESNKTLEKQNQIKDLAGQKTDVLTEFQKKQNIVIAEQARILGLTTAEWAKLTKQQQDYATKVGEKSVRDVFVGAFTSKNGSKEQAEFWADQYEAMGVPLTQKLSDAQKKIAIEAWNNSDIFALKPDQIKSFKKVQGLAAQYKFSDKESSYGLPSGLLSAIMMNESRGDTFRNGKLLTSESGAQGSFQFMPDTAKRFGVDVRDIGSSALGAAKYLSYLYKEFGDWNKAIAAYHAGEGNVARGTNIGPRTKGYVANAQKYMAAASGKTSVDNSIMMPTQADILVQQTLAAQAQKDLDDKRKEIDAQYYTDAEKLAKDHQDRIEKITQAYTGTSELKTRLAQEDLLYKQQSSQLQLDKKNEYEKYFSFEKTRIDQIVESYNTEKSLVELNTQFTKDQIAAIQNALERQKQEEIALYKQAEIEKQVAYNQTLQAQFQALKQARAIFSVPRDQRAGLALTFAESNELSSNDNELVNTQNALITQLQEREIIQAEYDRRLEDAVLLHEENKQKIREDYAIQYEDLIRSQRENELNSYNSVLSMASSVFSSMTGMAKDAYGEQSGAYKSLFLMQQAVAIGQATINAFLAYSQVLAQAPYPLNMTLAPIALGLGMANVGMIAGQTIAGMAHNGIDNIPKEGTWLLDGGERVLNPQQNQDLTRYLNERQSGSDGGDVSIQVNVTDSGVTTSGGNTQDQKQLGQLIGNAVRAVIRQEQRQGGLLYK
ncbi:transglycosylase SLT domain-containing protein [Acinetobacter guerrae]|uniref:transglycosylase SLT domain-containing protein n=1 Tax=Acinetobacter guerrae TaxID=1843371 RepID=UPI00125F949D|nr:transglycosylase SLT domain-containing protein [Acinetobacter guerrae]